MDEQDKKFELYRIASDIYTRAVSREQAGSPVPMSAIRAVHLADSAVGAAKMWMEATEHIFPSEPTEPQDEEGLHG